jgi:hypothetical protein
MMFHFTIGATAEGAGVEPASPSRRTALAERPGQPYPAAFRVTVGRIANPSYGFEWTHRESNPDLRHARAVSSRWTMSPSFRVDLMGVEPTAPTLQGSVAPGGMQARFHQRSVRESNPVFRLTTAACCRNTYRPQRTSDPGWS